MGPFKSLWVLLLVVVGSAAAIESNIESSQITQTNAKNNDNIIHQLFDEFQQRKPPSLNNKASPLQDPLPFSFQHKNRFHSVDITQPLDNEHEKERAQDTLNINRPRLFGEKPSSTSLKIFGTGLSRTGTSSLGKLFKLMGLQVIHFDHDLTIYLNNHDNNNTSVSQQERVNKLFSDPSLYDDVDIVLDLPTAFYYDHLMNLYPNSLFINTYREPSQWFNSFSRYIELVQKYVFHGSLLPFHLRELHKVVYGSHNPDESVWIDHYNQHYERVHAVIPQERLLSIDLNQVSHKSNTFIKADNGRLINEIILSICTFIKLDLNECPDNINYPHAYSVDRIQEHLMNLERQGKLQEVNRNKLTIPALANNEGPRYAYVTLLADENENKFKSSFIDASLVWCESIRRTYTNTSSSESFDLLLLHVSHSHTPLSPEAEQLLLTCFTYIVPIPSFGTGPRGIEDTRYYSIIRSKFWSFGLMDYTRLIFLDADCMVIRNMDHYFFRNYYDELHYAQQNNLLPTLAKLEKTKPKEVLTITSMHSPVSTSFFSFEPNSQSVTDLLILFHLGIWNNATGWMNYGPFDFAPEANTLHDFANTLIHEPVGVNNNIWPFTTDKNLHDDKYPFVPLFTHPDQKAAWNKASWAFYCSWSDQGAMFYYFYLYKNSGALISAERVDHEFIHFIGVHKPWIFRELDESTLLSPSFKKWLPAIKLWMDIAYDKQLPSYADVDEIVNNFVNNSTSSSIRVSQGPGEIKTIFDDFHKKVNVLRMPIHLNKQDPHMSTKQKKGTSDSSMTLFYDPYGDSGDPGLIPYDPYPADYYPPTSNVGYYYDYSYYDNTQIYYWDNTYIVSTSYSYVPVTTTNTDTYIVAANVSSSYYKYELSLTSDVTPQIVKASTNSNNVTSQSWSSTQSLSFSNFDYQTKYIASSIGVIVYESDHPDLSGNKEWEYQLLITDVHIYQNNGLIQNIRTIPKNPNQPKSKSQIQIRYKPSKLSNKPTSGSVINIHTFHYQSNYTNLFNASDHVNTTRLTEGHSSPDGLFIGISVAGTHLISFIATAGVKARPGIVPVTPAPSLLFSKATFLVHSALLMPINPAVNLPKYTDFQMVVVFPFSPSGSPSSAITSITQLESILITEICTALNLNSTYLKALSSTIPMFAGNSLSRATITFRLYAQPFGSARAGQNTNQIYGLLYYLITPSTAPTTRPSGSVTTVPASPSASPTSSSYDFKKSLSNQKITVSSVTCTTCFTPTNGPRNISFSNRLLFSHSLVYFVISLLLLFVLQIYTQ